ncbi:MAG TPA: AraC family transcriptional regulator [Chitinophaga sp.]|uniref:AraC family transcriptional regulator n=1 Tax=Chitinophaga sp. TaxID=1869181 RepID=UPI002C072A6B|nr:AraC family transcriptional regulator [Chitinophaga sp.]HVI46099.1 AraC family transcriptional regulator [Chitinophaga sp.]
MNNISRHSNSKKTPTVEYPRFYLYIRIVQAKLFIDNNYAEEIDLDNISDEAYFSKFHFIRLFKSIYGKTPHQYLISVRVEKAQQLLRNDKTVSEACFLVGFKSITTFSGLFKKVAGESPSSYAARHKEAKEQARKAPLTFVPGCYAYQHGWLENSNFEEGNI